jgi:hypothetical protein
MTEMGRILTVDLEETRRANVAPEVVVTLICPEIGLQPLVEVLEVVSQTPGSKRRLTVYTDALT